MKIGNKEFAESGKTYIVGILNVTPDSFSDGGKYDSVEAARAQAAKMIEAGADLIDLGGESTRPDSEPITAEEEQARILPVLRMLKEEFDIPVSVDTYHASTAKAAIEAGADMINDVWGLRKDKDMAQVIANGKVPVVIGHNNIDETMTDTVEDVCLDLYKSAMKAHKAGIPNEQIILDPGIGFAKTQALDLKIIKNISRVIDMGYPVMLGSSKKRVIGSILDLPVEERGEGTLAVNVYATLEGTNFLRVHDVKENVRAVKVAEAIRNTEWE